MNRRNFIKNSLLALGCSCLVGGVHSWYEHSYEDSIINSSLSDVPLNKAHLREAYRHKNELPKTVRMDLCTLCFLDCKCCYMRFSNQEEIKNGSGYGYLTFENFKKVVDDNNLEEIIATNNGEMFLNPDLLDIIKYAHKKKIKMGDYTGVNLNYLTDEMAEALVKYNFIGLTVSIDGATPETYAIYRRGGDFNTVIANIEKINYFKKKYNSIYPVLTYKFILFGHNEHEIDKAKELAKKLNMKMVFSSNYYPKYSPIRNVEMVNKKALINLERSSSQDINKNYKNNNNDWLFCKDLWTSPKINWDGKIMGCCLLFKDSFGGNVFEDGLLKALNNSKLIYAKNMLTNNATPIEGIPCTNCATFKLIKDNNLYIKHS